MQIRRAVQSDVTQAAELYDKVTEYLENNINYPNWTHKIYPSAETVKRGIETNTLFVCTENEKIIGEFILNTDPDGDYGRVTGALLFPKANTW